MNNKPVLKLLQILIFLGIVLLLFISCDDFSFYGLLEQESSSSSSSDPNNPVGDIIPPDVTITSSESGTTTEPLIPVVITFTEEVNGFDTSDITVGNGTAGNLQTNDNIVYTADITPAAEGTVTVNIAAGVCQDLSNNLNTAASQFSIEYISTDSLITETLTVIDGYDSEQGDTLENLGITAQIQTTDNVRLEISSSNNYWISFEFSEPSSTPAYIDSVTVFCEHYEQKIFEIGCVLWQIGTEWQSSPTVWDDYTPDLRLEESSEGTDSWDVSEFITATNISDMEFCIQNNENNKAEYVDFIYVQIKYFPE